MAINTKDSWMYRDHFYALQHDIEVLTPATDEFFKAVETRQEQHTKEQENPKLVVRFNRFCERIKRAHNENAIYQMFVWG